MKNTGIVRKLDELGRITLPIELRRTIDADERQPFEIYTDENQIILKKYESSKPSCAICKTDKDLIKVDDSHVCVSCAAAVTVAAVKVMEG